MKKFLLTLLIAVLSVGVSHAASQTVTLKSSEICPPSNAVLQYGNPKNYTNGGVDFICAFNHTYIWETKKVSYKTSYISFNKDKKCGIVSTSTIGKIVKVSANVSKNSIKVYASNAAYTNYQTTDGDLIGTLSTTNNELKFEKEYKYISFQENGASADVSEIIIEYETSTTSGPTEANASFDDKNLVFANELKVVPTFTPSNLSNITYIPQAGGDEVVDAELNVLRAGTQKVKATWAASDLYVAGSAEFTVTVEKAEVSLSYDKEEYSVLITEESPEFPVLTATDGIAVTYSSDNEEVATVNVSGEVSILAIGTANITATFAGNDCYKEASASYKLEVLDDSKVQKPTFVEAPGTYLPYTRIHLNCATEGATIYYMMSMFETPNMNDSKVPYSPESGIELWEEGTWYLHILAKKEGKTDSDIATGCFVVERGSVEDKFGFTKESETIYLGETAIYKPSLKGYDLDYSYVEYTVDKPEVLQVMYVDREAPKFIVLGPGTATITADLNSFVYKDATSSMTVTVTTKPETTTFDFTKLSEDGKTVYTMTPTTDNNYYIEKQPESINRYSFQDYDGKVTIETIKGEGNGSRLWGSTNGKYTWRVYNNVQMRISAPSNYRITDIKFSGSGLNKLSVEKAYGTINNGVFTSSDDINNSILFTLTGTLEAKTIEVNYVPSSDERYTNTLSFDKGSYEIYPDEEFPNAKFEKDSDVEIHYLLDGKEYTPGEKLSIGSYCLEAYTEMTERYYASYASAFVTILEIPAITKLNLHYTTYPNNSSPYYRAYITADVIDGVAEFTDVIFGNNIIKNPVVDGVITQLHCGEAYFSANPDNDSAIESFETPYEFAKYYYLYTPLAGDKTLVGQNDDLVDVKLNAPGTISGNLAEYGIFDSFALPGQKTYNITVSDLNTSKPKVLFHYVGEATGVDNVSAANNGAVEYFNLHGVRVDEPTNGIFIRRQGDKTSKVYIR